MQEIAIQVLQKGGVYALLIFFAYWFLTKYLPQKDQDQKDQIQRMHDTFKDSLDRVVLSFEQSTKSMSQQWEASTGQITERLDRIEDDIKQKFQT